MTTGIGATALALLLAASGCRGNGGDEAGWVTPSPAAEQTGTRIRITGVVRHLELEGGFYAIRGDDGVTYDPTNLPPAFQKDGLRVEVEARRLEGVMGIHQAGPIIEIERIRRC